MYVNCDVLNRKFWSTIFFDISTSWNIYIQSVFLMIRIWKSQFKNISNLKKSRGRLRKSAAPNMKYYYLARVLCTTSGKPSTRLPLGGHVELKPRQIWEIFWRKSDFLIFFIFHHFFSKISANWDLLNRKLWSTIFSNISTRWNFNIWYNFLMIHIWKLQFRKISNIEPRWQVHVFARAPIWSTTTLHAYYVQRAVNRQPGYRSENT